MYKLIGITGPQLKQKGVSAAMESSLNQANRQSVYRNIKSKKTEESEEKVLTSPNHEVHEVWNNVGLLLICMFLPVYLLLILDGCQPPTEPWLFFGAGIAQLWDWGALQLVVFFTVLQGMLYYLPLGKVVEGKVGHDGTHIKYSMNGLHALTLTVLLLAGLWHQGLFQGSSVTSRVPQLVTACTAVALVLSIGLYLRSFTVVPQQLVNYGTRSNFLQEFALGREMDPSLGKMDLKQFFMVRIGFVGWAVVDICYLLTEIAKNEWPSISLLLVVIFHFIYILDFLINEDSILPTKEYTEDGIGFIMVLGEFIWIPFYSSVPVYFLLHRPTEISLLPAVLICLMFGFGFAVYYLSNEEKSEFRKNPNNPALAQLWKLDSVKNQQLKGVTDFQPPFCSGYTSLLPYMPAIQCTNLLRLRAAEIEKACSKRHGEAWQEYCRRVPYKLVPYVY
ncbi:delta(14)-sterol reductase-like isoform X2 [Arapaima gigas]